MSLISAVTAVNFLAINCSDFDPSSYPVELAISLANGRQYSAGVKPSAGLGGEQLHTLELGDENRLDKSAAEVCAELNELCSGKTLYCDHWGLTACWMDNLFLEANITREFHCSPIESFIEEEQKLNWNARKQFVVDILRCDDYSTVAQVEVMQAVVNLFYREQPDPMPLAHANPAVVLHQVV